MFHLLFGKKKKLQRFPIKSFEYASCPVLFIMILNVAVNCVLRVFDWNVHSAFSYVDRSGSDLRVGNDTCTQDRLQARNCSPEWYVSWAFITCSSCQCIFHICPPSHPKIYFACLMAKCPCTWETEAQGTSISSSFFDMSLLASSVSRTTLAKSLSDFFSLGTFQSFKVIEKLALRKACCHLLLVSNLRSI